MALLLVCLSLIAGSSLVGAAEEGKPYLILRLESEAKTLVAFGCATTSSIPTFSDAKLPNPFLFNDGRPVRTRSDWACRREQIHDLIQGYEAGSLPGRPPLFDVVFTKNGTLGNLTIVTGTSKEESISFSSPINFPSGSPPAAGFPLIIAYGGLSIPIPDGVSSLVHLRCRAFS